MFTFWYHKWRDKNEHGKVGVRTTSIVRLHCRCHSNQQLCYINEAGKSENAEESWRVTEKILTDPQASSLEDAGTKQLSAEDAGTKQLSAEKILELVADLDGDIAPWFFLYFIIWHSFLSFWHMFFLIGISVMAAFHECDIHATWLVCYWYHWCIAHPSDVVSDAIAL